MGNYPSEYYGVKCGCGKDLPPCKTWDGFKEKDVDRKVDCVRAFVFHGGMYYRIDGSSTYYCPECFWKPKEDYIQRQEEKKREEARKREEERQREIARQNEEEQRRMRERQRQEELERRAQEAREEAMRQAALRERELEERRNRERLAEERKKNSQAQFEHQLSTKQSLSQKFVSWVSRKNRNVQQNVQIEPYRPFKNPTVLPPTVEVEISEDSSNDSETLSDELLSDSEEGEDIEEGEEGEGIESVHAGLVNKVSSILDDMKPGEEVDSQWLHSVQALLIYHFSQSKIFSQLEVETFINCLVYIRSGLGNEESISLTKSLSYLNDFHPSDYSLSHDLPLSCKFSSMLLYSGSCKLQCDNSLWMQRCFNMSVSAMIQDEQLQRMIMEISYAFGSSYDWLEFMHKCNMRGFSASTQNLKCLLHLVQAYNIQPTILDRVPEGADIIQFVNDETKHEPEKLLFDIINEMKQTELIKEATLSQVKDIVSTITRILRDKNFHIELDYNSHLMSCDQIHATKSALRQLLNKGEAVDIASVADAIITLMCAVQRTKGFSPRQTQLVALVTLLLSSHNSVSRLLEVLTGEGKSCIVAMFAAVLGVQEKHVDIITSSPILACRDAEEWEEFYRIFDLTVTHNTDLKQKSSEGEVDRDEERQACYKHHIIYGTVSNFSADVLREEFEQKKVRRGRRFDAVIVDEVDLLMLDQGVQFTYLSHNAAVLHHIEPVVAAVWTVIGQFRPAATVRGRVLYAGSPRLFTDVIFECLDPARHEIEEPSQLLAIANELNLIDEEQLQKLTGEDPEAKQLAMSNIKMTDALALLVQLEKYIPNLPVFESYAANESSLLEVLNTTPRENQESLEVKILLLGNGMACTLHTQQQLREGGALKVKETLQFSDDQAKNEAKVKLPHFLKDFVMNQVPTYVDNAIKSLQMAENREYAITKDGKIIPVDFQNSGLIEMNKKWGGGLQQFLEMKHNLCLSSMSVVTNFMSNIELFSRYKNEGGIYGLSGTLGLDSTATSKVLFDLFHVRACSIPTHKRRKLYERPAIIVHEGHEKWLEKLMDVINEAVKEEPWKKGRAILVLCEDIRTADNLNTHMLEKEKWQQDKVHLYAHNNSKAITRQLTSGEIIIATNLAGRGTDIKVDEDVDKSGGLLCLLTFLPRNRRVELQAFGRTGRKGKPGSTQCILKASSLPYHYKGLDLKAIRKLREEEEAHRLDDLIKCDVREVQLRERLFKQYCTFLQKNYNQIQSRDDKSIVVNSLNESWGQWLQMRSSQIEEVEEEELTADLFQAQSKWQPAIPSNHTDIIRLPVANFYHLIKFGNQLLITQDRKNAERACIYYTESIQMESRYATIAYYNRAYCTIVTAKEGYKDRAIADLKAALTSLDPYIHEVMSVIQCVSAVTRMRGMEEEARGSNKEEGDASNFTTQMQVRLQILSFIRGKIDEAVKKIEEFKSDEIEAKPLGVFSLIPDADYITNKELAAMWTLGLEVIYSIEKKPKFCWSGLICFFLGIAQITAGVLLTVFTVGTAASIGMALISEGISDCISGIEGMVTGEFSWSEYAISKATGLAISLATGGIARLASQGAKVAKLGYKVGKQLKAIPKIVKNSWGQAAKANLKVAAKYVAKEAAIEGISYAQNKLFDKIFESIVTKIGEKCKENLMGKLQTAFAEGKLGKIVDQRYIEQLPDIYISGDEMSPGTRKQAKDFFGNVGEVVMHKLVSKSEVKERLTSASLSLFSQISQKSRKGGKMAIAANVVEMIIAETVIEDTLEKLNCLIDSFIPEIENVCIRFITDEGMEVSSETESEFGHLQCAIQLKKDLAHEVGNVFSTAVATLLQQNLGSLVNHGLNRTVNHVSKSVLSKYVFKTERTLQEIKAGQNANYMRSVEAAPSHHGGTNKAVVDHYAKHVANPDNPGSVMDLRIAAEHYGQGVTIYVEKKGKLVRDCSIDPSTKKKQANIELVYTPSPDGRSAGHYDVLVKGKRVKIKAENSNCLFHAFAFGQNPHQSRSDLKQHANDVRQKVAKSIAEQPHVWSDHIKCRVEMDHLRKGNRLALIGAGPPNPFTKVLGSFYKESVDIHRLFTVYRQANGVTCRALRAYNEPIKFNKAGHIVSQSMRLLHMEVHMDRLNLLSMQNKRCWATDPVTGMIKRYGGKEKNKAVDSEVSFHLCPSRGGANAGNAYANAVMASSYYNSLEAHVWSALVRRSIGESNFDMTVSSKMGPVVPENSKLFFEAMNKVRREHDRGGLDVTTQDKLMKRFQLVEGKEPRAYRLEELNFTLFFPLTVSPEQLRAIEMEPRKLKVTTDPERKSATFIFSPDYDLFVPRDCSKLHGNGELHPGEITKAKSKTPDKQQFDTPPKYKDNPKATSLSSAEEKERFDTMSREFFEKASALTVPPPDK